MFEQWTILYAPSNFISYTIDGMAISIFRSLNSLSAEQLLKMMNKKKLQKKQKRSFSSELYAGWTTPFFCKTIGARDKTKINMNKFQKNVNRDFFLNFCYFHLFHLFFDKQYGILCFSYSEQHVFGCYAFSMSSIYSSKSNSFIEMKWKNQFWCLKKVLWMDWKRETKAEFMRWLMKIYWLPK